MADSVGEKSISETVQVAVDSGMEKASQEVKAAIDSVEFDLTIESKGDSQKIDSKGLAKGLKSLANGLEGLFKSLAQIGKGLTAMIEEMVEVNVELRADGSMQFSSPNDEIDVELNEEQLKWSVEEGQFLLDSESKVDTFSVEQRDDGFLLSGKDASFRLKAIEKQ